jgi:hypothetical protein
MISMVRATGHLMREKSVRGKRMFLKPNASEI